MDSADNQRKAPAFLRDSLDWLLILALLCQLPLLALFAVDLWYRTDYWFFPLLIVAFLVVVGFRGRLGQHAELGRHRATAILVVLAGALGVCAVALLSHWLAVLASALMITGWMLRRFGAAPWPRVVSWAAPLAALLLIPLSDAADPTHGFTSMVSGAASNLLDLIGIPQSASQQILELRNERVDVSSVCRGLGNPVLLFSLVVILCLLIGQSLFQSFIAIACCPLWSWGGAVLLVVVGAWISEQYEKTVLVGNRLLVAQASVLLCSLIAIYFFYRALSALFSPFSAHSAGVGAFHKFFNSVVLWPDSDPLRKRKAKEQKEKQLVAAEESLMHRYVRWTILVAGPLFLLNGAWGGLRFSPTAEESAWNLVSTPHIALDEIERLVLPAALPQDFSGMKLVGFDSIRTPGTATRNSLSSRWIYAYQAKQIEIVATLPLRGFYPIERHLVADGAKLQGTRQAFTAEAATDLGFAEQTFKDPVFGTSYLTYGTWELVSRGDRTVKSPTNWLSWQHVLSSISYSPLTANVQLVVLGEAPADDQAKAELQRILIAAIAQLRSAD